MFAERPDQLASELVLGRLKPLLEDPAVLKIGHNLKFDWVVLNRRGICVAPYDDTLVMSFNLDAGGLNSHSLDDLAKKHLDHDCIAFKDLCGTGQKQITFNLVQLDKATEYAAEDADVALRLWMRFRARLPFEKVTRVYEMVDRPMVAVIGRMERDGVKVDREVLKSLSAEFNIQIAALEEQICGEAGCKFTIGSPQQLGDILFNKMGLSGGRKGKSGTWSTDVTELERLSREGVPIAQLVLDWRQLTKLKSTYTDALQEQINTETGRVHTSYSPVGRADRAARLDRPQPDEHPDPHRDRPAHPRRLHRRAGPCRALRRLQPDRIAPRRPYLRRAAAARGVRARRRHPQPDRRGIVRRRSTATPAPRPRRSTSRSSTASRAGGWRGGSASPPTRRRRSSTAISSASPGISRYIADTLSSVRETGFTTTLFGRKTHFPRIKSKIQHERQGAERAAINAPIQGTAADIIKRAMARMGPALAAAGLRHAHAAAGP